MAVSPAAQGHGTGYKLGKALIDYARGKGVKKLFLEANTRLEASVKLYHKLGFKAAENPTRHTNDAISTWRQNYKMTL